MQKETWGLTEITIKIHKFHPVRKINTFFFLQVLDHEKKSCSILFHKAQ